MIRDDVFLGCSVAGNANLSRVVHVAFARFMSVVQTVHAHTEHTACIYAFYYIATDVLIRKSAFNTLSLIVVNSVIF